MSNTDLFYTTTDEVRAVLGLTDKELKDKMILDAGTLDALALALLDHFPDHDALVQRVAGTGATPDDDRLWLLLKGYCRYEAACHLLPQFQMIVVKKITDGDVEMLRFGPDDLAQFVANIRSRRDEYLRGLDPEFFATTAFYGFGVSVPAYDPVTNEGGA